MAAAKSPVKRAKKKKAAKGKAKRKISEGDGSETSNSSRPSYPLHDVAQYTNDLWGVSRVLEQNPDIDVDAADVDGFTALSYAASCGHHIVVRALCELGASVDLPSGNMTPLIDACFHLNVYLNSPAEHPAADTPDEDDEDSEPAAPDHDYAETVRFLLLNGANPNAQLSMGDNLLSPLDVLWLEEATASTALIASKCAQHLVLAGADLSTRDPNGMRPHDKASAMGFKAAAAVMRAHLLDAKADAGGSPGGPV
jgi:ankyrin repeat protein